VFFLGFSEIIRCVIYCLVSTGWHALTSDDETQIGILFSFSVQVIIGLVSSVVVLTVLKLFFNERKTKAV
jgi:uncharacterized membrane protein YagU involved in acid resistance